MQRDRGRLSLGVLAASAAGTMALLFAGGSASADVAVPALVVAAGGLIAFLVLERDEVSQRFRSAVLVLGGSLQLLAVVRPPAGSRDIWSYVMYGRILAVHHTNPYRTPPSAFSHDRFLAHVAPAWRSTRSVYGPGFSLLSGAIARIAGNSPTVARLCFQSLGLVAIAAIVVVLVRRGVPTTVLAAFLLNPLVIVWAVNGGHNDVLVGAALFAAALATTHDSRWAAGGWLAVAVSIKAVALLPALGLACWLWVNRGPRRAAEVLAVATGPALVGYVAFGGRAALAPLARATSGVSRISLWELFPYRNGQPFVASVPLLAVGLVGGLSAALVWHHRRSTAADATLRATAGYLVGAAYILPWYSMWGLPLAALEHRSRVARLVFAQSIVLAFAYSYGKVTQPDLLDHALRTLVFGARLATLVAAVAVVTLTVRTGARRARAGRPSAVLP
ncbi:MAG: hypothetical protein JWO37_196 [Acidimicrobiales bacterium]|jgi:alpha-1,6-mannosyltransferase|nr:hypothetical protein [Acidimicrobiales bacterium]